MKVMLLCSLKIERLDSQNNLTVCVSNKTKDPKHDSQNRQRPSMPGGGEP
jgi:hypothetical protein